MIDLSEESLESAIEKMRNSIDKGLLIRPKPTVIWVSYKYLKSALSILGYIKEPIKKVGSIRKRKRALYWRKSI